MRPSPTTKGIKPYEIPAYLLTDNGKSFLSKLIETISNVLVLKNLTNTANHFQTNEQAKRYIRTLIMRLCHCVAVHQRDWDVFVQPLTYVHKSKVNHSIWTAPFSLLLSRHLLGPTPFIRPSALLTDLTNTTVPTVLRSILLHHTAVRRQKTENNLAAEQHRYKDHHDCCVRDTASSGLANGFTFTGH